MTARPDPTPGTTTTVRARKVLVLAPHFDDEVLGCGGLLAQLARDGTEVRIVFLSNADGGAVEPVTDPAAYSARRRDEARRACAALGIEDSVELGLPDGGLADARGALGDAVRRELAALEPDLLLTPSPLEATADHRAVFAAVHDVLHPLREGDGLLASAEGLRILAYEVNHPCYPNLLVDVGDVLEVIERALDAYPSQTGRHPYRDACLGLLRFRAHSLGTQVRAAEAYVDLDMEAFRTRSLAGLIGRLGGSASLAEVREGPRVSVIVRTKDRPDLLAEALDSLAATTYHRAEVVVVNDGGAPPQLPADHPLAVRRIDLDRNRGRAAAANRGIREAQGDAITFLDDDDLAEPEHLATLTGLIAAAGVRAAYTDAAVGVYELDGAAGWVCRERRLPYSRDFDAELLLYDNYIPLNTLVFERGLLAEVGPFDEDLPFFEDWDLLIRCSARTRFHHHARVTCEYRQFRGADHHILGDAPRQRQDFLDLKARVIAKHAGRANPATAARVVDTLRAENVAALEALRRARETAEDAQKRYHREHGAHEAAQAEGRALLAEKRAVEGRAVELEDAMQALRVSLAESDAARGALGDEVASRDEHLRATYAEIERLGELITTMEGTRAWRLHRWFQGLRRR